MPPDEDLEEQAEDLPHDLAGEALLLHENLPPSSNLAPDSSEGGVLPSADVDYASYETDAPNFDAPSHITETSPDPDAGIGYDRGINPDEMSPEHDSGMSPAPNTVMDPDHSTGMSRDPYPEVNPDEFYPDPEVNPNEFYPDPEVDPDYGTETNPDPEINPDYNTEMSELDPDAGMNPDQDAETGPDTGMGDVHPRKDACYEDDVIDVSVDEHFDES